MDIIIGIIVAFNGVLFIIWVRKAGAPKWCIRAGVGLVFFGTLAAVSRILLLHR